MDALVGTLDGPFREREKKISEHHSVKRAHALFVLVPDQKRRETSLKESVPRGDPVWL